MCSRAWKHDPGLVKAHICLSFIWTLSCTHAKRARVATPTPKICGHGFYTFTKHPLQHKYTHTHKPSGTRWRAPPRPCQTSSRSNILQKKNPQSRVGVGEEMEIWLFTQHKTTSKAESIITYTQRGDQWAIDQWSNTKSYSLDDLAASASHNAAALFTMRNVRRWAKQFQSPDLRANDAFGRPRLLIVRRSFELPQLFVSTKEGRGVNERHCSPVLCQPVPGEFCQTTLVLFHTHTHCFPLNRSFLGQWTRGQLRQIDCSLVSCKHP